MQEFLILLQLKSVVDILLYKGNNMNKLNIFKLYWKENGKDYFLISIFIAIFSLVLSLYQTEKEAILYASVLCLFLFFTVKGLDLFKFFKKHKALEAELKNAPLFSHDFPKANTLCEADLITIIVTLEELLNHSITKNREKTQDAIDFYSTWVHQIKTPIAVLKMKLEKEDTKNNREMLLEVFRIEQYVEMVLSYLRLGSSQSDFVFKEYNLDSIIKEVIHKYAPQFIEKKISLSYIPTDLKVITDEKWLMFIIEQILSNALKYTKKGSISITVTKENILKITDTGIGIAPEDLPRIFEKGFTGYNGRADKKATGIGLYLCKKTAKKLSLKISVSSKVNVGTEISIDFKKQLLEAE